MAMKEALKRATDELNGIADAAEKGKLTDEQTARATELKAEIRDIQDRIAMIDEARKLRVGGDEGDAPEGDAAGSGEGEKAAEVRRVAHSAPKVEAVRSKSPYAEDNKATSYFRDLNTVRDIDGDPKEAAEARDRLIAHYESTNDAGGARVVRAYSAGTDAEGGYLVAPAWLQDQFVEMLSAGRPTADLVSKVPLPPKTDSVNIPTQDGATAVAVHTENAAVTETSATFNTVAAAVARLAGMATLPNFLLDRSMPGADQVVLRDLARQYAYQVNNVVLNSSTTNRKGFFQASGLGAATATAGTATIAELWPALLNAINDVASGVYMYPNAIIMHPRRWAWLAGQLDANDRPIIGSLNPQNAVGGYNGINVPSAGPQASGSLLGIPVYLDALVPITYGAGTDQDRILVGRMEEAILMETAPKFAISTENQFGKDQTVARVTGDVAFNCTRRVAAFSIIDGTALNDTI
jgi:HK97 family phage major capsid protein